MHWTVYLHIHIESGRSYVGLTKLTTLKRWNRHVYSSNQTIGNRSHFANAIRKYGKDAFSHHAIMVCEDVETGNAWEEFWIDFFNTRDPGYGFNLAKGGSHTPHPIKNPWERPEYREKATLAAKRKWQNPVFRGKQLARDFSHLQTPESRAAASAVRNTPEGKAKRVAASKAVLARPDVREKIAALNADPDRRAHASAVSKAAHARPDVKAKVSAASKASNARPEVKAVISESSKALWRNPEFVAKMDARVVSDETRVKLSARVVSSETRAKHSELGRNRAPEVNRKISASVSAALNNPEAKSRMSALSKERWSDPAYRAKMAGVTAAVNAARIPQTHCKRGHLLSDAFVMSDGRRRCRVCARLRKRIAWKDGVVEP